MRRASDLARTRLTGAQHLLSFMLRQDKDHPTSNPAGDASAKLHAMEHVVAVSHGSETVLLDPVEGEYFVLNLVGGVVWRSLEDGATVAQVVDAIGGQFDVPREQLERDVAAVIDALKAARLIEPR
jgi:hypothetical protein